MTDIKMERGPDYVVPVINLKQVIDDLEIILVLLDIRSIDHAQAMIRNLIEELSDD